MKSKVIAEPSLEEFTKLFLGINKGATAGLNRLGVFPHDDQRNHTAPERIESTLQVYHFVRQQLLQQHLDYLMPDIVCYEHTLCKVSRVLGQAPHSYSLYKRYLVNAPVRRNTREDDD